MGKQELFRPASGVSALLRRWEAATGRKMLATRIAAPRPLLPLHRQSSTAGSPAGWRDKGAVIFLLPCPC